MKRVAINVMLLVFIFSTQAHAESSVAEDFKGLANGIGGLFSSASEAVSGAIKNEKTKKTSAKTNQKSGKKSDIEVFQRDRHYFKLVSKPNQSASDLEITLVGDEDWRKISSSPPFYLWEFINYGNGTGVHPQLTSKYGVVALNFSIKNKGNGVIEMDDRAKVVIEFNGSRQGAYNAAAFLSIAEKVKSRGIAQSMGVLWPDPSGKAFEEQSFYPGVKSEYLMGFNAPSKQEGKKIYWTFPLDEKLKSPLKIHLYGIPVKVDSAGNVTRRANFSWVLYHSVVTREYERKKQDVFSRFVTPSIPAFRRVVRTVVYDKE